MKKFLLISLAFSGIFSLTAQGTALDWVRTECGTTNEHHLFAELDSGYVIMIDFVMMNCPSCISATHSLNEILAQFNESHPGKVRFYSVSFSNSTTCPQLLDWKAANTFRHPIFEKGAEETTYYGGMGMPTVVVLGGATAHKVYYRHLGYTPSQAPVINAAIDLALIESNLTATSDITPGNIHLNLFPNPFTASLTLSLNDLPSTQIRIIDSSGREFRRQKIEKKDRDLPVLVETAGLATGVWFVALYNGEHCIGIEKVVKE